MFTNQNSATPDVQTMPKALLKGFITAIIITFAVLVCFALLITYTPINEAYADTMVAIASYIAMAAGGFTAAKGTSGKGWLTGMLCALLYILLMWIAGSFYAGGAYANASIIATLIIGLLCGAAGGIAGINMTKS